jgi:hypothetical protein
MVFVKGKQAFTVKFQRDQKDLVMVPLTVSDHCEGDQRYHVCEH